MRQTRRHARQDNIQNDNPNRIQVALQDNNGDATGFTFRTVEGMAVHFFLAPPGTAEGGGDAAEPDNLGVILVDINGDKKPNMWGKDVFAFLLDASGILIPVGSNVHRYIEQNGKIYIKTF